MSTHYAVMTDEIIDDDRGGGAESRMDANGGKVHAEISLSSAAHTPPALHIECEPARNISDSNSFADGDAIVPNDSNTIPANRSLSFSSMAKRLLEGSSHSKWDRFATRKQLLIYKNLVAIAYCIAYASEGIVLSLLGPTLLDLANLTGSSIGAIGNLFTTRGTGMLIGSMIGGKLFDSFQSYGNHLLSISILLMSAMLAFVPLVKSIWILVAIFFVCGFGTGILDNGANVLMGWLFAEEGHSGPYLQLLHFAFGFGSFAAPIIIGQIMQRLRERFGEESPNAPLKAVYWTLSALVFLAAIPVLFFMSPHAPAPAPAPAPTTDATTDTATTATTTANEPKEQQQQQHGERRYQGANDDEIEMTEVHRVVAHHLDAGVVQQQQQQRRTPAATAADSGIILTDDDDNNNNNAEENEAPTVTLMTSSAMADSSTIITTTTTATATATATITIQDEARRKRQREILYILLISTFLLLYVGVEVGFGGWIFTFAVSSSNSSTDESSPSPGGAIMSETEASYLTSGFWGSFAVGRLLAVPISARLLSSKAMLILDLVSSFVSCFVLLASAYMDPRNDLTRLVLWAGVLMFGFSNASIYPTAISLPSSSSLKINVTGRVMSIFVFGACAGELIIPMSIGFFFARFDKSALHWAMLIDCTLASVLIAIIFLFGHRNPSSSSTGTKKQEGAEDAKVVV